MPPRPCLDCGSPTPKGPRCRPCTLKRGRARNHTRTQYQGNWDTTSRNLREQWVALNGWVCPGWNTPAHPASDLVADHITPRDPTRLQVLCRSCNSRKSVSERRG